MTARRALLLLGWMTAASAAFGQVEITTTSPLPRGFSTLPYTFTFTVLTIPTTTQVTWSLAPASVNSLPVGFNLSPNGTLAGTTAQYGTFTFQVTAAIAGFSDTETFSLTLLNPFITISSPPYLANGFVGTFYSQALLGMSNPAGLTWSLASGAQMPPGLSLSPGGLISGNPTASGTYTFLLNVQISGTSISTNQTFIMTVYAGQTSIQTNSLPIAFSGQPYSTIMSGGPTGITWALTGMLPPGITFNQNTGVFGGMTTLTGIYPIQLQANFQNYLSATQALTLYVASGPLALPQPNLAPAVQGSPYQTTVAASGGLPPYQWTFPGTTALGLSIGGSTGIITGTPQTSGNVLLPVILADATGESITQNLTLFIAKPLSVATTSLPNGSIGIPYSQALLPGGGVSPFTWTMTGSGSLPPGLSLSPGGVISGTPVAGGTYHFTVQVTDAGGRTATASLTISMAVAPLAITTSSLPNGQLTVAYSQPLAASGGVAPYTWSLVSGTISPGLSLNSNGVISGTPLGPLGLATFTVQVSDSSPPPVLTVQKAFTINIALTLTITTLGLPGGVLNVPYSQPLAGSGCTTPYTWSISSGTLPQGLQLNSSTGVISGTPTKTGPNLFIVTLADAGGLTAQQQLNISIAPAVAPPSITSSNAFTGTVGTPFSQALTATGGTPPYTWSISSGALPAGLQLSGAIISGSPTAAGTTNVNLQVTDSQQQTATQAVSITINLPPTPAIDFPIFTGAPATQPPVSLALHTPFPVDLTGTLSVSFQSAVGGNPTEVQFITSSGGSSTVNFTIAAGSTAAVFPGAPVLATGTVAGTITLTATLSAGGTDITASPATETIVSAPSAPVIQSVKFSNTNGSLTVTVIGYSTTREMVSGQFTFAPASGSTLSQSVATVQLGSAFSTWYQSSASNQWGGQFMLTMPFSVSGTAADVSSVSVTLTNTKGTSAAVTPQ